MHEAAALMAALGKARFTSQTFADHPGANDRPTIAHGPHHVQHPRLQAANDAGMGIFHMVNVGDLQGRRAENVTAISAYFVDLDGASLPDAWPLHPTAIIESSPARYHAYWRVTDAPLDTFAHVQKHLALLFGGDEKVHDLPRVMRLPGYTHRKGDPFVSRTLDLYVPAVYDHATILDRFAVPEAPATRAPSPAVAEYMAYRQRSKTGTRGPKRDLDTATARVATAPEGNRNHTLYRVASAVAAQVRNGELNRTDAERELELAATASGLDPHEVQATIRSAMRHAR